MTDACIAANPLTRPARQLLKVLANEPCPVESLYSLERRLSGLITAGFAQIRWYERPYKSKSDDLIQWAYITNAGRAALEGKS